MHQTQAVSVPTQTILTDYCSYRLDRLSFEMCWMILENIIQPEYYSINVKNETNNDFYVNFI